MHLSTLLSVASVLLAPVEAGPWRGPKPPKAPGLTFLYTLNMTSGPVIDVGQGPFGHRSVYNILPGGKFEGPRIKGKLLEHGGDWALTDSNSVFRADIRHTLQTDDGHYVQIFETGATQPDGTAHVRITYETGSSKYGWLNSVVGVGIIRVVKPPGELRVDVWQLTAP